MFYVGFEKGVLNAFLLFFISFIQYNIVCLFRYDEAAVLQNSLRGGLGTAKKRQGARSALIHGYLTHLPDVAKKVSR